MTAITPDPVGLKALAHPVRLRMLELLRLEGPATSTTLALQLGLNTGATSYHLRQLALHGFIVEDEERGNGRDRWWRAAHQATRTGASVADPSDRDAFDAYSQAAAVVYAEQLQRAIEERMTLPAEWRRATTLSDWTFKLSAEKAQALVEAIVAVVEDTTEDEEEGAHFVVQLSTYSRPGTVS